ncbi:4Fe-4S dicluster domain-containing protein [Acetobacterium woodii]|uniref:Hydrogenase, Fe-S subunit HycB1 n=1 Tax=Acetobacterium woodii (strain ATCC 29683 / DSM 1030 / JCM 2381 / KCTC 1655 / WB1) TaxID=931626 RepID=H6LB60_ACEWD|nr:4Fe-4S dicluster domain-containing protein [Acetobacterium woodii]AFA47612.1 hydrogenase, Fe-S subunit HycB1 [Acetobacterium woodii DSM 1030]
MNYFVKGNPDLCIGCRTCMISCVIAHEGEKIFQMNPGEYVFNPKLDIVKTATITVPVQCKHCENPACMNVCPVKAIKIIGCAVVVTPDKCIGCKTCMIACPYGAINMIKSSDGKKQIDNSERMVANKCDLCVGREAGPACIQVCPTASLKLVTQEDVESAISSKRIAAAVSLYQVKD